SSADKASSAEATDSKAQTPTPSNAEFSTVVGLVSEQAKDAAITPTNSIWMAKQQQAVQSADAKLKAAGADDEQEDDQVDANDSDGSQAADNTNGTKVAEDDPDAQLTPSSASTAAG